MKEKPAQERPLSKPEEITFLLVEDYTHLALSSCLEVLRVANLLADRELYRWSLMAPGGHSQKSSNGLVTLVQSDLEVLRHGSQLYIVSGLNPHHHVTSHLRSYLRKQQRLGVYLGAICSGAYFLAEAGLLTGQTCAVHWHYYPMFREKFQDITLSENAFVSKSRPYTASGGTAGAELMLSLVARAHGEDFSKQIADQLVMPRVRTENDVQKMPDHIRFGTRNPILLKALECMNANIEDPMSTAEIGTRIGVSARQIERVFQKILGHSPGRHYKRIRLTHAKNLLMTTDMSVIQIALATGFSSASHFSRVYRAEFGRTPFFQASNSRARYHPSI